MNQIKLILATLFFLCLANMSYGYYQLIRMIALIGFVILAYQVYYQKRKVEMIIYLGLALLFQPFFKVALGREIWNVVDLIVGLWLILSVYINRKIKRKETSQKNEDLFYD